MKQLTNRSIQQLRRTVQDVWKPRLHRPRRKFFVSRGKAVATDEIKYAKIKDSILLSANRWLYHADLVDAQGNLITADYWPFDLYNRTEQYNTATGVQGNGINVDTLITGFSIQPLTTGYIYPVIGGMLSAMNSVDGECPEET